MEFTEIAAAVKAARRVEVQVGPCTFDVELPPNTEAMRLSRELKDSDDAALSMLIAQRYVKGWHIPREVLLQADLPPGGVPFSQEALSLLADERPDIFYGLSTSVVALMFRRLNQLQEDQKNWPTTSKQPAIEGSAND